MNRYLIAVFTAALLIAGAFARVQGDGSHKTLLVTMTNDPAANGLIVIDAATHARLQTISTNGKGGGYQPAPWFSQTSFSAAIPTGRQEKGIFRLRGGFN